MTPLDRLIQDSSFLQQLHIDEDYPEIINDNIDKLLPSYMGIYPEDSKIMIDYIDAASYLGCEDKISELFIILHFRKNFSVNNLIEELQFHYNRFQVENTKLKTFIRYDLINTLKFIENYSLIDTTCDTQNFILACKYGSFKIIQWMYNKISYGINSGFEEACKYGHLEIAKWLYSKNPNINICWNNMFSEVCRHGRLEVAQWLYSIHHIHSEYEAFKYSLEHDHVELVKWLYGLINKSQIGILEIIRDTCEKCQVEITIFLIKESNIDIHYNNDMFFTTAFVNECIELVKWLYNYSIQINSPINIHNHANFIFIESCYEGNVKMVNWLYSIDNFENVQKDDIFVFCCNNNLEIAKILYSHGGINIHCNNNEAYQTRNKEVLEWLYSLE